MLTGQLEIYLVGGAVRDGLIAENRGNLDDSVAFEQGAGDRDWVVVGSTPEQLLQLGFKPVGKDFPVFLHPETKEEYALARTERKRGQGHTGFSVDANPLVTLDEDLSRRDLTINAIARDDSGNLIDPFDGLTDIQMKRLRHVSPAFEEDPLRVFRAARLAAQLPGFTVAAETQALMSTMSARGDLRSLSAERVWQEFVKALAAPEPARFFEVLAACSGLVDWMSECQAISGSAVATFNPDPQARFALLPLAAGQHRALADRLRAPKKFLQLALDQENHLTSLSSWPRIEATVLLDLLGQLRATHETGRLQSLIGLVESRAVRVKLANQLIPLVQQLKSVVLPEERRSKLSGSAIGEALDEERCVYIAEFLSDLPPQS